jgi:hypothetical protein
MAQSALSVRKLGDNRICRLQMENTTNQVFQIPVMIRMWPFLGHGARPFQGDQTVETSIFRKADALCVSWSEPRATKHQVEGLIHADKIWE